MTPFPQSVDEDSSNTITSRTRSPLKFFGLIFAFSIPFWLAGALTGLQLLPGLPLAALMFVCPATAAAFLVYGENKTAGMIALLERSFDYRRIRSKIWYAPIFLLMPGVYALSYVLMRLVRMPVPTPQFTVLAPIVMVLAFFVAALGEELGWSGYVIDPMQERWGALGASHSIGFGVGCMAHHTVGAGAQIADMDRLVVSLHGGVPCSYRLDI